MVRAADSRGLERSVSIHKDLRFQISDLRLLNSDGLADALASEI